MTTGNCKYEQGTVHSCFDCDCDECAASVAEYENYLREVSQQEEFNRLMEQVDYQAILDSRGGCHE